MQRLPIPGKDKNVWGGILNKFLLVEHRADGSLKIRSDGTLDMLYKRPESGIPLDDLSSSVQAKINRAHTTVQKVNGKTPAQGAVVITKKDIGLGNVDNTADADKPISKATQAALDKKIDSDEVMALAIAL